MSASALDVNALPASPLNLISCVPPLEQLVLHVSQPKSTCCILPQCRAQHSSTNSSFLVHHAATCSSASGFYGASCKWCTAQFCCTRNRCIRTSGYVSCHARNSLRATACLLQQFHSAKHNHRSASRWAFDNDQQRTYRFDTTNLYNRGNHAAGQRFQRRNSVRPGR
jgi:hypothetical protein